ncbi:hypothetical protein LPC08_12195 [Roseomonas sp. OT10]|uniref:hypothetical protein n=1 Tax=Roseomonas cutis TaxID=2897332 RepID=UPI001E507428|nr:hypothetical protein [Roseomonas sp. OT10]UFN51305.1 hypothetical protein LPC08_12195 [Roseomonas sp. OT10]
MIRSRPIDVSGRFVGVAVAGEQGWSFVATDPAVGDLTGSAFSSAAEVARMASLAVARARMGAADRGPVPGEAAGTPYQGLRA